MTITAPPALAGICTYGQGVNPGLSVGETVIRLRRYVYLETQSVFIQAAHFNGLPEWEVKGAISLHLWQDAEHGTWLRKRVTEMRTPPHNLDKVPDPALETFTEELKRSHNTAEFLTGLYEVLKPALAAAFREHLAQAHPIADYPTRRLLRMALGELEDQIAWGQAALAALFPEGNPALAWRRHLQTCLEAAGGVNGDLPPASPVDPTALRATEPFETSRVPRRDARFPHVWRSRGELPADDASVHERIWWMLNVRLQEMHVSELIAATLSDWKDQPWEMYHELARHLWDETRHCMLGEIAFASQGIDFTKIPSHIGFAEYPNLELSPADRYSFLWGIEQSLMTKSGKQAEVALAKAGEDELATVFQDFDWADEVLHAQIGRRWLEPHYGSRENMGEAYTRVRSAYDEMKARDLLEPGRNWWPAFYAQYLKHKDAMTGSAPATPPPADRDGY